MKLLVGSLVLVGICRVANADALQLDGEAIAGWPTAMWAGVSLHFEHPLAAATGVTLRGSVARGEYFDTDITEDFTRLAALAGVRQHWDVFYAEAALGAQAVREPIVTGDLFPMEVGSRWVYAPTLEPAVGVRLGHVDLSVFMPIDLAAIGDVHLPGLRVGGVFDL